MDISYQAFSDKKQLKRFKEIDRKEIVKKVYHHKDGELHLKDEYYDISDWSNETKQEYIDSIEDLLDRGGDVVAAIDNELDKLVGLITLDNKWIGDRKQLNLAGLWISHSHRNMGIASKLVEIIIDLAKSKGATSLYVSATPSKNTVEFYQHRGFRLVDQPDPILFAKEPEDIHMVLQLN